MRVAVYNQMFGLNGKSFWSNMIGHWAVHFQGYARRIWKRVNLDDTLNLVKKLDADVIGIVEVLEGQEVYLKDELRRFGYKFFYIGRGHKTKYSGLFVQEIIASKIKLDMVSCKGWPVENCLGGGGGFIHVFSKKLNSHFVLVHLGLPSKRVYIKQLNFLKKYVKKLKGKVVLFGDFNLSSVKLENNFVGFNLFSGGIKTCSETPIMKWFYNKDVDHIFGKGFSGVEAGTGNGKSDHKAIYVDLK